MKKCKKILFLVLTIIIILTAIPVNVQAKVQSREDGTVISQTWSSMFELIRKMESEEGPMGLSATIGTGTNSGGTTILETSSSNNIDVHMIKNTEWGVVAMLQKSIYGSNSLKSDYTTTGTYEKSGVKGLCNGGEAVAGMYKTIETRNGRDNKYLYYAPSKYVDFYSYTYGDNKVGDGMTEMPNDWLGTGGNHSSWVRSDSNCFVRNYYSANLFNFYMNYYGATSTSRAAVVCGKNF